MKACKGCRHKEVCKCYDYAKDLDEKAIIMSTALVEGSVAKILRLRCFAKERKEGWFTFSAMCITCSREETCKYRNSLENLGSPEDLLKKLGHKELASCFDFECKKYKEKRCGRAMFLTDLVYGVSVATLLGLLCFVLYLIILSL